jgi:soluble lytic murein transglycosylase-like protein
MKKLGIKHNQLFHIDHNIHLGCWILRDYYNEKGSIRAALTKYVGGNHKKYIDDILEGFADEMIPRKEPQKKE